MTQRFLTKQELLSWVDGLVQSHRVIAPVRDEAGGSFLQEVASAAEVDLQVGRPTNSVKEFFFPATESLLHIRRGKKAVVLRVPDPERPQVLFAVRPCDAAALTSMDALFLGAPLGSPLQPGSVPSREAASSGGSTGANGAPADPYWGRRRQDSVLVGLGCVQVPTPECFCTTVGGSPLGTTNLDVMLYTDGAGYVAEALTERGAVLLAPAGGKVLEQPYVPQPPELAPLPCPPAEEWLRLFNNRYWERLGERCLGCKICTYNCPTCYCFDIRDCGAGGEVDRLRAWDACTSKHYSVEASGHDPRPTRGARLRNRFYHKYYYFPWRYHGTILCSGCGRCVAQCPVNIDLTQILEDVSRLARVQE